MMRQGLPHKGTVPEAALWASSTGARPTGAEELVQPCGRQGSLTPAGTGLRQVAGHRWRRSCWWPAARATSAAAGARRHRAHAAGGGGPRAWILPYPRFWQPRVLAGSMRHAPPRCMPGSSTGHCQACSFMQVPDGPSCGSAMPALWGACQRFVLRTASLGCARPLGCTF